MRKKRRFVFGFALVVLAGAWLLWHQVVGKDPEGDTVAQRFRSWVYAKFPDAAERGAAQFGFFAYGEEALAEDAPDWVILAHGLDEPGGIWANLAPELADAGYAVFEFRYPNDQAVSASADFLAASLAELTAGKSPERIALVGHSMGGLVLREFLSSDRYLDFRETGGAPVTQLLQVATPNHGSWLAKLRFPLEFRDQFTKDLPMRDRFIAFFWDGTGEAKDDLSPGSDFLTALNSRSLPEGVFWGCMAGTGSPFDMNQWLERNERWKTAKLHEVLEHWEEGIPELVAGKGDGAVRLDSAYCEEMDEFVTAPKTHRDLLCADLPEGEFPPAVPWVLAMLSREK